MSGSRRICLALLCAASTTLAAMPAAAADTDPISEKRRSKLHDQATKLCQHGARFLIASQEKDGGWASDTGPGITAIVVKALAQHPDAGPDHPAVRRGATFVRSFQRDDGGLYGPSGLLKNYETSVALSMFAALDQKHEQQYIRRFQDFLKKLQWDEGENKPASHPWYGGAGYGHHQRPDLSNTQVMLDALRDSGLPEDDPTYKKALIFIQRCQMWGETNDQPFAKKSRQGGFIYSPANGGESKAETVDIHGRNELRCYGSMTYAGFKSMLYAGLNREDPRVHAAIEWIRANYTLDHNPNMPHKRSLEGVYYYYHTFARALSIWGEPIITDASGKKHNWRLELVQKLESLQRPDGRWVNDADRWMEGHPALTTAYAMLALQAAFADEQPPSQKTPPQIDAKSP